MRSWSSVSVGLLALVCILPNAGNGDEKEKGPKLTKVSGPVIRADANNLIIGVKVRVPGATEEETRLEERVFGIDTKTKIQVQSDEDETFLGEGGQERKRPKLVDGTPADFKVGKRVVVTVQDDKLVTHVLVLRDPPPRRGEGERETPAPPRPPRKSESER